MSNYNNAPAELRALPWVCWQSKLRNGKWTKIPVTPTGAPASVTDPRTWSSFDACVAAAHRFNGVGYVLRKADGHVVIDGDATDDPHILDAHRKVFEATRSYAETSPSGRGFHIILRGTLPGPSGRRRYGVEMYDDSRFFTFTGDTIDGRTEILGGPDTQAYIDHLYQELGGQNGAKNSSPENRKQTEGDADICERLRRGSNGAVFDLLFTGSWQLVRGIDGDQKYPSASEADQGLANLLAQQTKNREQIERIIRASGMAIGRDKKFSRKDYLKETVMNALAPRPGEMPAAAVEQAKEDCARAYAKQGVSSAQLRLNGVLSPIADVSPAIEIVRGADIQPKIIYWLWRNWIAKQKLHVLYGSPEAGKSTLLLSLSAILSRGRLWPDGSQAPVGNVLIWSGEDNLDDTLIPRLIQMEYDADRVRFIRAARDAKTGQKRAFKPATDLPDLVRALDYWASRGWKPDLIIIDPLVAVQAGKGDQNSNVDSRAAFAPLTELSETHDCAVIGIHHVSKGTQGRGLVERATGSVAVGAVSRIMLFAMKNSQHDEDPDAPPRVLGRAKGNIGRPVAPIGYTIKDGCIPMPHEDFERGCVEWLGEIEGTIQELADESEKKVEKTDKPDKIEQALEWLRVNLVMPTGAADIMARAKEDGISSITLRRASDGLVDKTKDGMSGWIWTARPELWAMKTRR